MVTGQKTLFVTKCSTFQKEYDFGNTLSLVGNKRTSRFQEYIEHSFQRLLNHNGEFKNNTVLLKLKYIHETVVCCN